MDLHGKNQFKDTSLLCTCWLDKFSVQTLYFAFTPSVFVLSIDREEGLVSLSLLPEDTGKSDVLPESLGLPVRLIGKKKCKAELGKNKRKMSESEQVCCFQTCQANWHCFSSSNAFQMFCLIILRSQRRKRRNQRLMAMTVA